MKIWLTVDREDDDVNIFLVEPEEDNNTSWVYKGISPNFLSLDQDEETQELAIKIKTEGRKTPAGWILELNS